MSSPDPPPLPPHISTHQPQQAQPQPQHHRCESKSLLYILNHGGGGGEDQDKAHNEQTAVQMFFDQIYQRSVAIYHTPCRSTSGSTGSRHRSSSTAPNPPVYTPWAPTTPSDDNCNNTESSTKSSSSSTNPLQDVFENGHSILYDLMNEHITLQDASESTAVTQTNHTHPNDILLFQNQQIIPRDIHYSDDDENVILKYCSTVIRPLPHTDTDTTEATDDDVHTPTPTTTTVVNLHAAYLDGCSIVMNHADTIHPYIAGLCQDLQDSFPHVYANVYLTPLSSQTVPAHADDRDVFIIQVVGCKLWTIYTNIPIPFPYPSEQVGKSSTLPVPDQVLHGPILFQSILQPGDVLYIPRGYVHEAQCVTSSPPSTQQQQHEQQPSSSSPSLFGSFHITIAIATHDWSLLGLLQSATSDLLSSTQLLPVNYRKAIDRQFGQQPTLKTPLPQQNFVTNVTSTTNNHNHNNTTESNHNCHHHHDPSVVSNEAVIQLQQQIDTVLQLFRREITVSNINQALYNKYTFHNQRASQQRNHMMQQYFIKRQQQYRKNNSVRADDILTTVGYDAAQTVTLHSNIRAVTDLEKKTIAAHQEQQRRNTMTSATSLSIAQQIGLHVREDIYDDIMTIIQHVKSDTKVPKWYQVYQLRSLLQHDQVNADSGSHDKEIHQSHPLSRTPATTINSNNLICDVTLLSLARRCVELGAFAIVPVTIPPSTV